jgi:hypothetical protein
MCCKKLQRQPHSSAEKDPHHPVSLSNLVTCQIMKNGWRRGGILESGLIAKR